MPVHRDGASKHNDPKNHNQINNITEASAPCLFEPPQPQYSMGSEAGYSLKAADAPRAVVGRGSMHLEANYGESFPTGWVWAQV